VGEVLATNGPMLKLGQELGFAVQAGTQPDVIGLSLRLNQL
jgi:hypothetical protein